MMIYTVIKIGWIALLKYMMNYTVYTTLVDELVYYTCAGVKLRDNFSGITWGCLIDKFSLKFSQFLKPRLQLYYTVVKKKRGNAPQEVSY